MHGVYRRYLTLLLALLAAMTLSLPARARIIGGARLIPVAGPSAAGQTGSKSSEVPAPARIPLCHLCCRGFVAGVPDAPAQQHTNAPAALEPAVAYLLPPTPEIAMHRIATSPPESSPPLLTVLRL